MVWGAARTDVVTSVTVTLATFGDGGWFGPNGPSPAAGGALTGAMLSDPVVQVLGAGVWTTVGATSNYISQMTGHLIGGGGVPNPSSRDFTLTLTAPAEGITGLRVIGSEGGAASNGFVGFFEVNIQASPVPEPSVVFLTALCGMLGLTARGSRRPVG